MHIPRLLSSLKNSKYIVKFKNEPEWNYNALNDDELEKAAYFTVCNDIISRLEIYEKNKKKF